MSLSISAYIPCYNNAASLGEAIASILQQTHAVEQVLVVDDGSTDGSVEVARDCGVQVVSHERNLGRGAARHRAMQSLTTDLVLCCDATNRLHPEFIRRGLHWFDDDRLAAVFGRFAPAPTHSAIDRWRNRHLFLVDRLHAPPRHRAGLNTYGAIVRRSTVMEIGNYDARLRRGEDANLGNRLLAAGFDTVCDPQLTVVSTVSNTLPQVLERYWRWKAEYRDRGLSWHDYLKLVYYSVKILARRDLKDRDWMGVPISLLTPHYQLWQSRRRASRASGSDRPLST
ncbi:glycosyltransferase family 2 protein [Synechococcus sp. PCC 7336]|uniref:glycosyltransferase family 2 protein n=1 Tax=Synechococcus sp. PCC 7336 TaxID=195250 RepID=UPI00034A4806|nr:glycosyltransferase family 2 protein [Synechococcus sp. PCC 7336]